MHFSVSIIVCTYNPDERVISRLLQALINMQKETFLYEIILVDNNSTPSITEREFTRNFLKRCPHASVLVEQEAGLTAARLAGIAAAQYEWLLFFDDDNEPAADYLVKAAEAIEQHTVAAWGPGSIKVEYTDGSNEWLNSQKTLFQERHEVATRFDHKPEWQECYPFGTGMIIRKEIALEYASRVKQGRYTLSDRKGKSLASGGDVQLVLTAIEKGYAAGVVAGMQLVHIIDASKANLAYMRRQQYGTASAYIKAYNQVFEQNPLLPVKVSNKQVLLRIYSLYRIYRKQMCKKDFQLLLASRLGEINAAVVATGQKKPFLLRLSEQLLHV